MVSVASHPFSSWAMISAAITADCFWSAGYFAISRSIFFSASGESISASSPVDIAENDVHGADDRHRVGQHVAGRHLVHRGEVAVGGRAQLHAIGLVGPVGDEIHAELALRVLDPGVGLAPGHVHALGEE